MKKEAGHRADLDAMHHSTEGLWVLIECRHAIPSTGECLLGARVKELLASLLSSLHSEVLLGRLPLLASLHSELLLARLPLLATDCAEYQQGRADQRSCGHHCVVEVRGAEET